MANMSAFGDQLFTLIVCGQQPDDPWLEPEIGMNNRPILADDETVVTILENRSVVVQGIDQRVWKNTLEFETKAQVYLTTTRLIIVWPNFVQEFQSSLSLLDRFSLRREIVSSGEWAVVAGHIRHEWSLGLLIKRMIRPGSFGRMGWYCGPLFQDSETSFACLIECASSESATEVAATIGGATAQHRLSLCADATEDLRLIWNSATRRESLEIKKWNKNQYSLNLPGAVKVPRHYFDLG